MCGIVGISAETNVAGEIYDSLLMLQHRGQDAAGMVVCDSEGNLCLLYTSPSPRDRTRSRMPSSA